MIGYYSPDGDPMTVQEWTSARHSETWKRERLVTRIGDAVTVSTVWLGIDHQYGDDGLPIIFETLIFGGPLDQEMWRYATREQAHAGHERAVRTARAAASANLGGGEA